MRLPYTRPVLPRAISAKSGLRFWGMMLLPVVNSSDSRTKSNSRLDQITISSDRRDTCIMAMAAAAWNSARKSRSATASMLLGLISPNPRDAATAWRSVG